MKISMGFNGIKQSTIEIKGYYSGLFLFYLNNNGMIIGI